VSPPLFAFGFFALLPTPQFASFGFGVSSSKRGDSNLVISNLEIRKKFQAFAAPLINADISLFTDESRREDEDSSVSAAIYSPELGIAIKHKLPPETSIFSAEAWAVYQALILVESSSYSEAAIFSDSRSVLDALSSFSLKSSSNYLIPLIRDKFHTMTDNGFIIRLVWIPSHVGIPGNERADSLAKQATINDRKPKFKVPHSDLYSISTRSLKTKFQAYLTNDFSDKGIMYSSLFVQIPSPKHPWFYRLSLPRDQIVAICILRSNHYNLNYSLHRKNIVASFSCLCGDPQQDINHVIFRCSLYREKSFKLRHYLSSRNPPVLQDLLPSLKSTPKLCRLIAAFFKSCNLNL